MAVRNWRWWQWMIVSVFVGVAVGLALTTQSPDDPSLASVSFVSLRSKIDKKTDAGDSIITRIRVGPVSSDPEGKPVQSVTFWEQQRNRVTGRWDPTMQFRTVTPVPLSATSARKVTVLDFLADKKKQIPTLDYQYQWWLVPRAIWMMSIGGSVLLIGVLWPMALRGLVKLGLAAPPDERMDLSQTRTVDDSAPQPTGPQVTARDHQQLADLNAQLAANVSGMTVAPETDRKRPDVPEPIRLLNAAPADTSAPPPDDKKPEDFKGEFYPVARPVVKKE